MTGNRFDVERIVGVVAKRAPDLLDAFVDALFKVDERVAAPKLLLNLIASYDLSRAARQHCQQPERLRRKLEHRAIFTQFLQVEIELEDPETK